MSFYHLYRTETVRNASHSQETTFTPLSNHLLILYNSCLKTPVSNPNSNHNKSTAKSSWILDITDFSNALDIGHHRPFKRLGYWPSQTFQTFWILAITDFSNIRALKHYIDKLGNDAMSFRLFTFGHGIVCPSDYGF